MISSSGPCVSMEIQYDGVGGAKRGVVPVVVFPLSSSPHLGWNRVPETHADVSPVASPWSLNQDDTTKRARKNHKNQNRADLHVPSEPEETAEMCLLLFKGCTRSAAWLGGRSLGSI